MQRPSLVEQVYWGISSGITQARCILLGWRAQLLKTASLNLSFVGKSFFLISMVFSAWFSLKNVVSAQLKEYSFLLSNIYKNWKISIGQNLVLGSAFLNLSTNKFLTCNKSNLEVSLCDQSPDTFSLLLPIHKLCSLTTKFRKAKDISGKKERKRSRDRNFDVN